MAHALPTPRTSPQLASPRPASLRPASLRPRSEERRVGKECRSLCDWSSDVCSSDLNGVTAANGARAADAADQSAASQPEASKSEASKSEAKIGRASCRERV